MKIQELENLADFCILVKDFKYINFDKLNHDEIEFLLNKNNSGIDECLSRLRGLKVKQIDKILSRNNKNAAYRLSIYHEIFTSKQFKKLLNFNDHSINDALCKKNLTKNQIQSVMNFSKEAKYSLLLNSFVPIEIKQKIIDDTIKENIFK